MNNVREGKINGGIRILGKKGEPKALLISGATAKVIDLKELPQRLVRDLATEPEVQVTAETPLVDPMYAGNPVVAGASAVAGFDVTQTPPTGVPQPAEETSDIPEIVPVSFATPAVKDPVIQPVGQVPTPDAEPTVVSSPQADETPVVQVQNTPRTEPDPVVSAIDTELVRPQPEAQEQVNVTEQPLQTPQAFEEEVENREAAGAYVNVIDEMVKVRDRHLLELRKIQEDIDAKFDALKAKYQEEFDNIVRATEKLKEGKPNFAPIQEALDNQNAMLNGQGLGNVR